jgi:hypothetical protein
MWFDKLKGILNIKFKEKRPIFSLKRPCFRVYY